jgi:hypothetical protein
VNLKTAIMKKIYLLLAVGILAATISASAQNVVLRMDNNYDVTIDGRKYQTSATISDLGYGRHTVHVYRLSGGILGIGKKKTLVSTSDFELRNNDVTIDVDQNGQLRINELGNYNTQNRRYEDRRSDRDDDDRDRDRRYDRNEEKNGRGYGPYNNPGKGNKYGLYKDKKDKKDRSQKPYKNRGNK